MSGPERISVVLDSFAAGGAQRVALAVAANLDRERFAPEIVVLDARGALSHDLPAGVPVHALGRLKLRDALWGLTVRLRASRPRAVLSTLAHVNFALIALRPFLPPGLRIVVREANMPSMSLPEQPYPELFRWAYRHLYRRADAVVCPSRRIADELAGDFAVPPDRLHVLPNPVAVDAVRRSAARTLRAEGGGCRFVAVGRLVRQKGFDRLFPMLKALGSGAHLTICGDGPERGALEKLAAEQGVSGSVEFLGHQCEPWPWIAGADALLLPSRWEGMPNVALEALAAGTPVIASVAAGGIGELAGQAPGGAIRLAEDGAAFERAMHAIVPSADAALRPCLLPSEYSLMHAVERIGELFGR